MIDVAKLREGLGWSVEREGDIDRLSNTLIATLEEKTNRLWKRRVGFVHVARMRTCTRELGLPLWPVESIAKVEVRGEDDTVWTELALGADYKTMSDSRGNLRVLRRLNAERWESEARVTMTGGYTDAPTGQEQFQTPDEVLDVLILQAKFVDQRSAPSQVAVSSVAVNGAQTTFMAAEMHPTFKAFCEHHRRRF